MAISIVQLGTPRGKSEGLRIGTVRRPPRGVPKSAFASRDYYDVWLPELAPSEALVRVALRATTDKAWQGFVRRYRAEMKRPAASRLLDLLAGLSQTSALSVGCYCLDETRCHRSASRHCFWSGVRLSGSSRALGDGTRNRDERQAAPVPTIPLCP